MDNVNSLEEINNFNLYCQDKISKILICVSSQVYTFGPANCYF